MLPAWTRGRPQIAHRVADLTRCQAKLAGNACDAAVGTVQFNKPGADALPLGGVGPRLPTGDAAT
ncbi:hypothetical protein Asru_0568_03 [Acidisphaera rubrifaciens HS-AP3]|uniref:Uncharacterized protein n=1 Tax=Acidisphaera rubrifaciens HS-AP3 TaxID=1231350 RepID=A0A0D6P9X5_9PROT|nr:hypothetical protein Asru_0568_03 [Acidisphaera rubrifaciens HS-AP3]